ncbi:MAG TPA: hypothetical protein VKY24_25470 [Reyranella sp.]|nr:hypothetical protein [Reyranella sp.]
MTVFPADIAPAQSRPRRASVPSSHFDEESAMNDHRKPAPEREHLEGLLDDALDESFPASDPVAIDFRTRQSRPAANDDEPGSAHNDH